MPVWHASVGLFGKPVSRWNYPVLQGAWRIGCLLLAGAGDGQWHRKEGEVCVHVRRMLNDDELKILSDEWKAIPAVDMA